MRQLKLEGEGSDLYVVVDDRNWAKCYLQTVQANIFLGSEEMKVLATRLIFNLDHVQGRAAGEIGDRRVWWVVSLSEGHHALYFYSEDGIRTLLWQDAAAKLVGKVKLSGEQY